MVFNLFFNSTQVHDDVHVSSTRLYYKKEFLCTRSRLRQRNGDFTFRHGNGTELKVLL